MGDFDQKVIVHVVGTFRLTSADAHDVTPHGRKTCALLALLALSPAMRRSRVWIQEHLWGTRGREQGAASLRQSLLEIRKALGASRDCLKADKYAIGLNPVEVSVNTRQQDEAGLQLLEGLDQPHEKFQTWLVQKRQEHLAHGLELTLPVDSPDVGKTASTPPANGKGNRLLLVADSRYEQTAAHASVDTILDLVSRSSDELGIAKVLDRRGLGPSSEVHQGEVLKLEARVLESGGKTTIRMALRDTAVEELIWSTTVSVGLQTGDQPDRMALQGVNQALTVAAERYMNSVPRSIRAQSWRLCGLGLKQMFKLGVDNFKAADGLFSQAYEIEPLGIYLAWRAYLRTFLLAERQYSCRKTIEEEAFYFLARAFEIAPLNSYVSAIGAHVHGIMRRSYVASYEFAERSIQLNGANPIGWACLGIAQCYLGQTEDGYTNAMMARRIAGSSVHRYQLDTLACIAAAMSGRHAEAIHLGEASHAMAPTFAPPLRYLSALYFSAGDEEQAYQSIGKLQGLEPDFSLQRLLDVEYPAAGLRRTTLLDRIPVRQL